MNIFELIVNKVLIMESKPQRIGLSQFKEPIVKHDTEGPSLRKKDVKLSDLMRRAS